MKSRRLFGALVACAVATCSGCNDPPVLRSVDVRDSTTVETGPYEVRAVAHSPDGFGDARLLVEDDDDRDFTVDDDRPARLEAAFVGTLPGRPGGTVLRFALEICDPAGACLLDPASFPTEAHELIVGAVPAVPSVRSLTPDHGPQSGGAIVTIDGDGFRDGVTVHFDDTAASHVERLSSTLLRVITPPHAAGLADVVLTNLDGGEVRLAEAYRFDPGPSLIGLSPDAGPTAGGTDVIISGAGFVDGDRVLFDEAPCRQLLVESPERLSCRTPPGRSGAVDVVVVHPDGGRAVLVEAYRYVPPPRIDAVSPDRGSSDGGTLITVIGDDFDVDTPPTITVGEAPCVDVEVVSSSELRCTTSAGPPGVADVDVVNGDGQRGLLPGGFNRLGPPLVLEIDPDRGPHGGGVIVRLYGAGLDASDRVAFVIDGAEAEAVVIDNVDDLELEVLVPVAPTPLSPAPATGFRLADVRLVRQRPEDQRETVAANAFRYLWPPEVTAVVPGSGPTAGGTRVVVVGRFFTDNTRVQFDGAPCLDVSVVSSTELVCTTPPGDAGTADVQAFTDDQDPTGGLVAEEAFTYVPPPTVVRIAPDEGPTFGGDAVTVGGADFQPGAAVFIDGAPCRTVVFVSSTELRCLTPPGQRGPADVRVQNPDGQQDTATALYTYVGVAVQPDHGLPVGFTRVRVRAAGLRDGVVIRFGGVAATCQRLSDREAICQTPAVGQSVRGLVEVRFTNPDGTGDGDDAFTYNVFRQPQGRITSIGHNANHVVLDDFDGDGDLDAVVANGRVGTAEPSELYRNTAGVFARTEIPGTLATSNKVDVGHINNDTLPDLVFGASDVGAILLQSSGPAQWTVVDLPLGPEESAFDAQLADLVGDERDDLLVLGIGCDPVLDFETNPGCDPVRFGRDALFEQVGQNGGSRLTRRDDLIIHERRQAHDHKMTITDLDNDGDNDVVIVVNNDSYTQAQNRILRNRAAQGQGFIKEVGDLTQLRGDLYDIDAGDIDNDGDNDVVTSICLGDGSQSSEVILRNDGGQLTHDETALPIFETTCAVGVKLLDVDDDGDLDVMWSGTRDVRLDLRLLLRLFVNRGDGTFVDASTHLPTFNEELQGNHIEGGDLDGDGDLDLLIAGGAPYADTGARGRVLLFEQRPPGP